MYVGSFLEIDWSHNRAPIPRPLWKPAIDLEYNAAVGPMCEGTYTLTRSVTCFIPENISQRRRLLLRDRASREGGAKFNSVRPTWITVCLLRQHDRLLDQIQHFYRNLANIERSMSSIIYHSKPSEWNGCSNSYCQTTTFFCNVFLSRIC